MGRAWQMSIALGCRASDAAASDLAGADKQGSVVTIYMGGVDRATGQVIPSPHLLFIGELDVPTLTAGANTRELEYEVASIFERFFADDEGARLSTGFHQSIWPGELGFDFQTGVPQGVYWGVEAPPRAVVRIGTIASPFNIANWVGPIV